MFGSLVDVQTSDGFKLHGLLCSSDPDRRTIWIIVHGVNGNFYGSTLLADLARCVQGLGHDALLVNTRGHDLATFGSADYPARMGSMFEKVSDGLVDLAAWIRFCKQLGYENIGCIAHSLGAVKVSYSLAHAQALGEHSDADLLEHSARQSQVGTSRVDPACDAPSVRQLDRFIAISPPRLNTQLLLTDPAKREIFDQQLNEAMQWCEKGIPHHIMRIRFPLANWVCAETFIDKYGSGDKYDYFAYWSSVAVPTLWVFGQMEVRQGSVNFRDVDRQLQRTIQDVGLGNHQVNVIPNADHSYRGCRDLLAEVISRWIRSEV